MMKIIYDSEALNEFAVAVEYYREIDTELARRFRDDVVDAVRGISRSPLQWPIYADEIRRRVLPVFPYSVFYIVFSDSVKIVAVMHSSREPDYWLDRLD